MQFSITKISKKQKTPKRDYTMNSDWSFILDKDSTSYCKFSYNCFSYLNILGNFGARLFSDFPNSSVFTQTSKFIDFNSARGKFFLKIYGLINWKIYWTFLNSLEAHIMCKYFHTLGNKSYTYTYKLFTIREIFALEFQRGIHKRENTRIWVNIAGR